jgi:hypothetical protein
MATVSENQATFKIKRGHGKNNTVHASGPLDTMRQSSVQGAFVKTFTI